MLKVDYSLLSMQGYEQVKYLLTLVNAFRNLMCPFAYRDPSVYPDFDTFRPERFLDESGQVETAPPDTHNMGHTSYGFGTR